MKYNKKYCSVIFNMAGLTILCDSLPQNVDYYIVIRLLTTMAFNRINIFLGN